MRSQRMSKPGDPQASAEAVLKIVDAENPPLRVFFGELPLQLAKADYESRLKTWEEWQPISALPRAEIFCASRRRSTRHAEGKGFPSARRNVRRP